MIPVSTEYIESVTAQTRQFKSRATITMDAFSQLPTTTDTNITNFSGKVVGSTVENPNIAKFAKQNAVQTPTGTWTDMQQSYTNAIMTADNNPFDVHATISGNYAQMMFKFDLVTLFERKYGTSYWQGGTTLAEKIAILKTYAKNLNFHWRGYGSGVSQAGQPAVTTYNNVRYIRDYENGNSVNANNYWNEIQALTAGGTNRAAGKTPTISSGTLTNGVNITDGNLSNYGYEASGNGVAKYVQIDLGAVYNDITQIKIVHYYADGRTFHGTKTQISADGTNWTTLFDSAVSGEYVETSAGKTYAVPSTTTPATNDVVSYQVGITYWNASTNAWMWSAVRAPQNTVITDNVLTVADVTNLLGSDGFVIFTAYTQYPATATTPADLFTDYVELDFDIVFSTTRQYQDDVIMRFNVVEDISILNDSVPSNELTLTLNNNSGDFDLLTMQSMLQIIASRPHIFLELGLVEGDTTEWIPMGKYFVTEWKNDLTSKVVTFTANDYFKIMADTNYAPSGITNLHDLAVDVLTKAGVPTDDQVLDDILSTITVNNFTDNIDCRSAIQQIAIVAQCAVYQDRYGNLVISPFTTIDKASNYVTYPSTQNRIPMPYLGSNTYPLMSTGSGMRNITYDSMYSPPEIVLEQSVYQLIVKVYDSNGNEMPDAVYTNSALNGDSGVSFTIDSKLVNSVDIASKIAAWYFAETNYNAIYTINWRQNPALECTDVVLINDPFHAEKQSRIIHQEIDYEGYLSGVTQSRGGV